MLLLSAVASSASSQQFVRGQVVDDATNLPISDVQLHLIDLNRLQVSRTVRTDSSGRFLLQTSVMNPVMVRAVRIGYEPVTTPRFRVPEGHEYTVELRMARRVQLLAPLTIISSADPSKGTLVEGFEYRRSRALGGHYISRQQIEDRSPGQFTDLLQAVAGVRVTGSEIEMIRRSNFSAQSCIPAFYLDGMPLRGDLPDVLDVLNMIDPTSLHGVEVYTGASQVPAEFSGSDAACGVVAVWTGRGRGN
jgi:hypothetical protein